MFLKGLVFVMKCILLAAGYATRLYPLTEHMPKALLMLGSKTILDRVFDKIEEVESVDEVYIVTNHRFADNFSDWAKNYKGRLSVKVLDDGTTSNDNRLGAIGDINYVLENANVSGEILVMASDNIFDFSLNDMDSLFKRTGTSVIAAHYVEEKSELQRMGVVEFDDNYKVVGFVEKPQEPKTHWGVLPFYFYTKEATALIPQYLADGNNPDAPGHLVPYIADRVGVYGYTFDTMAIDIGTPKSLEEAQKLFD